MNKNDSKSLNTPAATRGGFKSALVFLSIPILLAISFLFYIYVMGDPSHFQGGDPANHPIPGDYFGIVYKGGYVVPFLIALFLMVIVFSIERYFTISKATGKSNLLNFTKKVRGYLATDQIGQAIEACDKQQGSVANVVKSGLEKYQEMEDFSHLDSEKKTVAIQKEIEETTQLEMPALEKNLVIISTIASIATLIGLFGTVLGMIKAFAALAQAGAPDAVALANGISEALVNTALGILASAVAIVSYNYFTTKIDKITYSIDEVGFTIVQTFVSKDHAKRNTNV